MSYRSYYLYQKYQSINGSTPAPVYPMEYSYDGEGTMPTVVKSENDAACGYMPPLPPVEPLYRWVDTDEFICEADYSKEYLTIESLEDNNTIYWKYDTNGYSARTISASTDNGQTWTAYTSTSGGSGTTIATLNNGDKLLIKGQNNTYRINTFNSTKQFKVYGNIMSLVSGDTFENADTLTNIATFTRLFKGATGLVDAENLVLPATTLTSNCYEAMFENCTSLTTAPSVLPATTLIYDCYYAMFYGCTSLTTAPQLPATTLADRCYSHMFNGCYNLTVALELPATTMAYECYEDMFSYCTSLTTAPELPATTLAIECYHNMFQGCTSLTVAPELPATTLANDCYNRMFSGCTSLTVAPELPATTLANACYASMFNGCTSLTVAPELPATTLSNYCYSNMFYDCTSLTAAPLLPATTLTYNCYDSMFYACTSLNYIKCLATNISATQCTRDWVFNVAALGTFVKASSMGDWTSGTDGIPNSWTVQNA